MPRLLLALALVATSAGGARATTYLAGDPPDPPIAEEPADVFEARTDLGVGTYLGSYSVGPVSGPAHGMHVDVARRFGALSILGEYALVGVGDAPQADKPVRGHMHRGGLGARYAFARFGGGDFFVQGELWTELGLGVERIRWHAGGELDRVDASFGLGGQANFRIGGDRPRVLGVHYALRLLAAPGVGGGPASCAGPCDRPTEPYPYDLGAFFNMGLTFGR